MGRSVPHPKLPAQQFRVSVRLRTDWHCHVRTRSPRGGRMGDSVDQGSAGRLYCLVLAFALALPAASLQAAVAATPTPQVSAGDSHTVALKSDGTLWAWGFNTNGQLGDGTTTSRPSPVQTGTEASWMAVSAGGNHTVALKSDGTLWAWGYNRSGEVGDGTTSERRRAGKEGRSRWSPSHDKEEDHSSS